MAGRNDQDAGVRFVYRVVGTETDPRRRQRNVYEILGIEDLVKAKKTQRDKDWPMIRRLVDAHYDEFRNSPNQEQIRFWLRESRTPAVLIEIARKFPQQLDEARATRPLLEAAALSDESALELRLANEQAQIRAADKTYWQPLIQELHQLREAKRRST